MFSTFSLGKIGCYNAWAADIETPACNFICRYCPFFSVNVAHEKKEKVLLPTGIS
jgi:hypothetical protein